MHRTEHPGGNLAQLGPVLSDGSGAGARLAVSMAVQMSHT